ncbi:MAG TPA: hypothetical protein VFX02_10560 [Gammaproteobacteria bacterium]|nr:hypothetical protein [Gammaproteobacteria bacterium]
MTLGKSGVALVILSAVLALSMLLLHNAGQDLRRELSANGMQCEQRISRLRGDYQAEIDALKEYLRDLNRYSPLARPAEQDGTSQQQTPGELDPAGQAEAVNRKYRYMYDVADQRETVKEMLRDLLLQRELYVAAGNIDAQQMAAIEAQIGELLGAGGYQEYQLLKDSDPEQHHLREYEESLGKTAPLSREQDRSLLLTKLKYKQAFKVALNEAGLYQPSLTGEGQEYARIVIRKALQEYQNNYLNDVRPLLSAEQYEKLSSHESTVFGQEMQRLMKLVDAKAESAN